MENPKIYKQNAYSILAPLNEATNTGWNFPRKPDDHAKSSNLECLPWQETDSTSIFRIFRDQLTPNYLSLSSSGLRPRNARYSITS